MYVQQTLNNPFGISVFGSAIIRVDPDIVSLRFAVSRIEKHPRNAFQNARQAMEQVRAYLAQAQIQDVGTSRVGLSEAYENTGGKRRFIGYRARVDIHVLLRDLDRMEEIISGVVDAGVNNVSSVDFQTTRLQKLREEARKRAFEAARQKALVYCETAGVNLGPVMHIEDLNPDQLRGGGHVPREPQPDDEGPLRAVNPGSVTVGGAVMVAFEIGPT